MAVLIKARYEEKANKEIEEKIAQFGCRTVQKGGFQ
jgi:hypothetical protein